MAQANQMDQALLNSPRRALTPDQKKARDDLIRDRMKNFSGMLKSIVENFNNLMKLNRELAAAGKGTQLMWQFQNGTQVVLNKRILKSAQAQFAKDVMKLKEYFRVSKKKAREPGNPATFSGTYAPIFAGPALRTFFTAGAAGFGPKNPYYLVPDANGQTPVPQPGSEDYDANAPGGLVQLMGQLPYVQQGFLLRNTCTMLFYIYAHASQLQDQNNAQNVHSDEVMNAAFGGDIPASFFSSKVQGQKGKIQKVLMPQAVASGLVPGPINTYEVISRSYPANNMAVKPEKRFNPANFNSFFFQNIAAPNYFSFDSATEAYKYAGQYQPYAELENVPATLQDAGVRAQMRAEHDLVKAVSAAWKAILEPGRKAKRAEKKKIQDAAKRQAKLQGAA